ncbi:hypothetical protein BpHYR1_006634 [Brachionus plicatilis]|uniref:Uncharacterized protein n=1 Tax=Brachionus plicatilis TaxID=10195 RepID=A0A3M7SF26_BRAPC|nr:hypothetical protein BpHYR1_006634 [Brachionus plicatilis]
MKSLLKVRAGQNDSTIFTIFSCILGGKKYFFDNFLKHWYINKKISYRVFFNLGLCSNDWGPFKTNFY